jgi:two-component system CheB/CheR fusion protein
VVIAISDNGVGIAPGQLAHIFSHFGQGDAGEKAGGLGLGLAIARGIVEGHKGRISVASGGPGQGATFEVELASVPAPAMRARRARPAKTDSVADRRRILLVEDHEDTAEVLGELLSTAGFSIELAHSVGEALRKVDPSTQLVISDIGLPDGSGLEMMQRLRERDLKIPGIALSGYGSREDRRRSRAAGFLRHLVKPIKFEELVAAIREIRA